ncbi:2-phosphosulfolactate phosphatase family protein [Thermoanaerobacterium thermosaccharolyticum]|uniref:2-phosphosulfolactate phosphatase family protein n=1 Tax=Thermoanaerobacterium thermosaccharolyticum TaxID=1517 RepID=UPI0017800734|nr:2-phosphosulfolactate phosphatase family protein [Thermoanaerobacterium thermosaccharolyticum]MBE0068397.1 2-phosphosulfolactate phosphatase family protein [Thermoanaerobacterium thermosaccharolyticum]MBE0228402.1 2-phosphosulfolactate phosphatase family protein [Thermoanaerobacterium thermosaccharolyticum]
MFVETYETYNAVSEKKLKEKVVVVIDTLRATSVITTALVNGAKEIIPVADIEDAIDMSSHLEKDSFLLGGERNAVKIDGFDLSNSPLEYSEDVVKGKTIIITTTNGTRALKKASSSNDVVVGCLLNVTSVADYIHRENKDVVIICAGTEGKFSIDDIITAGAILNGLKKFLSYESDDLSKASYFLYKSFEDNILNIMKYGYHLNRIEKLGFHDDIEFCTTIDKFSVVPKYVNGVVRLV